MQAVSHQASDLRLQQIALARQSVLQHGDSCSRTGTQAWIERSWQRCLTSGKRPEQKVSFDMVAPNVMKRLLEANRTLVQTARPVLQTFGRAIATSRYFAVLTDAHGVVIDAYGAIDRSDPRADLITRVGTDLSENKLATTAISAALTELQPVWLHRGEHFFDANSVYSCAGAPLFGPDGACIGMLDLTGIETFERPELKHLVAQSARSIENALTIGQLKGHYDLLIRLNWPGRTLGDETDGLVCLDADGYITAANQMARLMMPQLVPKPSPQTAPHLLPHRLQCTITHASDLFAISPDTLFDAARKQGSNAALDVPLWTGLRLHALPILSHQVHALVCESSNAPATKPPTLKTIEAALIRKAVNEAHGNVQKAATSLGISRATVYRRLGASLKH